MSGNTFGNLFAVTNFGESHGSFTAPFEPGRAKI